MGNIKERNSNHELLRIIAMYMIVFIHANMFLGNFCEDNLRVFFNGLVNGVSNIGVTCFILISGYYGIKFDIRKLVKMECMMISYSLLELIILCVAFPGEMQGAVLLEQLVKSLLPFITRKYWFYSCYVCLFLFSGYIQRFIEHISQKEFQRLLVGGLVLFSAFPTFFYFELIPDNGKGLVQMILIYLIGRYIKLYGDSSIPKAKTIFIFIVLWAINGISHEIPVQMGGIYHHLCKDNSITNIIMAIILFYMFKGIVIRSQLINKMAAYIFAVFALNNSLVSIVMKYVDNRVGIATGDVLGFGALAGIVLLILLGCLLLGSLREWALGKVDDTIVQIIVKIQEKLLKKKSRGTES